MRVVPERAARVAPSRAEARKSSGLKFRDALTRFLIQGRMVESEPELRFVRAE